MSAVYICTQGTSVANGNGPALAELGRLQRELQKGNDPWNFTCSEFEKALQAKLVGLSGDALTGVSAELTVLAKKGVKPGDRVVLLCTDGYLGRVCGEAIQSLAVKAFGLDATDVEIVRVPDLQVKDGERLSRYGLRNFIECARRAIENYNGLYTIYLCPNGGFKGVVPFLTLLGLQYHCNVLYTFEFANNVVTLPPLPFTFDRDLYLRARRALAALTEKVEAREEEYLADVDGDADGERDLFLGFVQYTRPGYVTPSPLVDAFVSASSVKEAMLSKQALEDLEREKKGKDYLKFCRLIANSQDPVWRQKALHTFYKSDLIGIKPTHSTMRLLGYMVGSRFYVARVLQHDAYEQQLKVLNKKDFPVDGFSRWQLPDEINEVGDNLSTESELLGKNERLLEENRRLKADVSRLEDQVLGCEESLENANKRANEADRALQQAQTQVAQLEQQTAALRHEMASLRSELESARARLARPWYRRIFG